MRFEIGPGGMLVILLGLAGLSGAVFGLGMVAGHELSGPEPGSQPVAAAYPLPAAAPASAPSVAAEASAPVPAAPANAKAAAEPDEETAGTETTTTTAAANPPAKPAVASAPPLKAAASAPAGAHGVRKRATSNTSVASRTSPGTTADEALSTGASVAPPSGAESESAEGGAEDGEGEVEGAPAAPAAPPRRHLAAVNPAPMRSGSGPYSVQIDAMMDRSGAQEMAQKMRAKGFEPYIVPTLIDGQTWYRLRVGHYATPEQAQAAESKLHQEFDHAPTGN